MLYGHLAKVNPQWRPAPTGALWPSSWVRKPTRHPSCSWQRRCLWRSGGARHLLYSGANDGGRTERLASSVEGFSGLCPRVRRAPSAYLRSSWRGPGIHLFEDGGRRVSHLARAQDPRGAHLRASRPSGCVGGFCDGISTKRENGRILSRLHPPICRHIRECRRAVHRPLAHFGRPQQQGRSLATHLAAKARGSLARRPSIFAKMRQVSGPSRAHWELRQSLPVVRVDIRSRLISIDLVRLSECLLSLDGHRREAAKSTRMPLEIGNGRVNPKLAPERAPGHSWCAARAPQEHIVDVDHLPTLPEIVCCIWEMSDVLHGTRLNSTSRKMPSVWLWINPPRLA